MVVEERLDGSMLMFSNGTSLTYKELTERPQKEVIPKTDARKFNRSQKPSKDHPWKKSWKDWMPARQQRVSAY